MYLLIHKLNKRIKEEEEIVKKYARTPNANTHRDEMKREIIFRIETIFFLGHINKNVEWRGTPYSRTELFSFNIAVSTNNNVRLKPKFYGIYVERRVECK